MSPWTQGSLRFFMASSRSASMDGHGLARQIVGLNKQKWWIHELELIKRLKVKATRYSTCWESVKAAIVLAKADGASIEVQPFGAKVEIYSITCQPKWAFIGENKLKIKHANQSRMVKIAIGEAKKNRSETDVDGERIGLSGFEMQDLLFLLENSASFFPSIERIDLGNRLSAGIIDSALIEIGNAIRSSNRSPEELATGRKQQPTTTITPPASNLRRHIDYDADMVNAPAVPTETRLNSQPSSNSIAERGRSRSRSPLPKEFPIALRRRVCQGQTYSFEYICPQLSTFLWGYIFSPTRPIFLILIIRVRRCLFYHRAKGLHLNHPSLYCFNCLAVNIFKKWAREI
jgi:hypothetical protein